MQVQPLTIPDVKLITPKKFGDARGWFVETYSQAKYVEAGIDVDFVQDNHSYSAPVGVLRGLHCQFPPHAQGKLVRVARGKVLDVAVDIRKASPTYGQHVTAELSAENGCQLFVPVGFLHGFVTLEPDTEFLYKVSGKYAPECDAGVRFDDPDLGIDWGIDTSTVTLSDKDKALPYLKDFDSPF